MRLYDTARREVVPFEPGPIVTLYTCGITPYDATHLGHAATYLTYDVLQRRLRDLGHETRCVRNITDVDDSILGKARELGVHYLDLAAAETARFDDDMDAQLFEVSPADVSEVNVRLKGVMAPPSFKTAADTPMSDSLIFLATSRSESLAARKWGRPFFRRVMRWPTAGSCSGQPSFPRPATA